MSKKKKTDLLQLLPERETGPSFFITYSSYYISPKKNAILGAVAACCPKHTVTKHSAFMQQQQDHTSSEKANHGSHSLGPQTYWSNVGSFIDLWIL